MDQVHFHALDQVHEVKLDQVHFHALDQVQQGGFYSLNRPSGTESAKEAFLFADRGMEYMIEMIIFVK